LVVAEAKHRDAIVAAASHLFRRDGYAATGMNDIVAESGAPKGSIYHYFPSGKAEIGAAAVLRAGEMGGIMLRELAARACSPEDFLRTYAKRMSGNFANSGFRLGCPVATLLLENAPQDERITAAGRAVFAEWALLIGSVLERDGMAPEKALRLGKFAVSAMEGGLIQARVEQSLEPLDNVLETLIGLFDDR
jgi:TetR/AcrR family transcriptional repressor of lmrAB and yxaGH operons